MQSSSTFRPPLPGQDRRPGRTIRSPLIILTSVHRTFPLGIRQRLSLAVAVVHQPEILILDEPTSGVDPLARDRFWELLIQLSRDDGVTIFVSTHFMNEAERCDRISLMDAGRVLATDTPAGLVTSRHTRTLEEAFISYLEEVNKAQLLPTAALAAPPDFEVASVRCRKMVQFRPSCRMRGARRPRVAPRSDPAGLCRVWHDIPDVGLWLWHLDGCQLPDLRGS